MPPTVRTLIVTSDLDRLVDFYVALLAAVPAERVPDDGPAFFVGLTLGDSALGVVADGAVTTGRAGRVAALGGRVTGGPTDMPWGQRVLHLEDPDGNPVNLTEQL